jgi:hypothetical protein
MDSASSNAPYDSPDRRKNIACSLPPISEEQWHDANWSWEEWNTPWDENTGSMHLPPQIGYIASISAALSYGVKELGWISENPSLRVSKLKETPGRDRILTQENAIDSFRFIQAIPTNSYILSCF